MRQVRRSLTTTLSNHHQRLDTISTSALKYRGTPFWAALRRSPTTGRSTSASIYSLPSRTTGSTRSTRSCWLCSEDTPVSACTDKPAHTSSKSKTRSINGHPNTRTDRSTIFDDSRRLGKQGIEEAVMRHAASAVQRQQLPGSRQTPRVGMPLCELLRLLFAFLGEDRARSIKHMAARADCGPQGVDDLALQLGGAANVGFATQPADIRMASYHS